MYQSCQQIKYTLSLFDHETVSFSTDEVQGRFRGFDLSFKEFFQVCDTHPIPFCRVFLKLFTTSGHIKEIGTVKTLVITPNESDDSIVIIQSFEKETSEWQLYEKYLPQVPNPHDIGMLCDEAAVHSKCLLMKNQEENIVVFPIIPHMPSGLHVEYTSSDTPDSLIISNDDLSNTSLLKNEQKNGLVYNRINEEHEYLNPRVTGFVSPKFIVENTAWFWNTLHETDELVECKVEDPKDKPIEWMSVQFALLRYISDDIKQNVLLIKTKNPIHTKLIGTPVFVSKGVVGMLIACFGKHGLILTPQL